MCWVNQGLRRAVTEVTAMGGLMSWWKLRRGLQSSVLHDAVHVCQAAIYIDPKGCWNSTLELLAVFWGTFPQVGGDGESNQLPPASKKKNKILHHHHNKVTPLMLVTNQSPFCGSPWLTPASYGLPCCPRHLPFLGEQGHLGAALRAHHPGARWADKAPSLISQQRWEGGRWSRAAALRHHCSHSCF